MNVAFVGCGVIAHEYAKHLAAYDFLALRGAFDLDAARTRDFAEKHGGLAYDSLESLLADPDVDLVANLTLFSAHFAVTRAALQAGKHVFSEKPLAGSAAEAAGLVDLARARGVRLACAPATFLGAAQQRVRDEVRGGRLGTVRLVYAEANHGRIEAWHPQPTSFYEVGPLRDVGVYPLGIAVDVLGPASRVTAFGRTLWPDRLTKRGVPFGVTEPDFWVALIEFASGPVLRLTANFYAPEAGRQRGLEFFGDDGQLHLDSWIAPSAGIAVAPFGGTYEPLANYEPTAEKWNWASGLADLGWAVLEHREPRASGERAAHIVEILEAARTSARSGAAVELRTTFAPTQEEA